MLGEYFKAYQEAGLDTYEFMLLVHVYEHNPEWIQQLFDENYMAYNNAVDKLERNGLIKKHGPDPKDIMMRQAGISFFNKHFFNKPSVKEKVRKEKGSDTHIWITLWRELFPEGVNNLGYRYRGNKAECLKKMTKFANANDFTREEIFKATRNYVARFAIRGYAYMQQAHFFIEKKDTGSSLASECESLREGTSVSDKNKVNYGRTIR